MLYHKIHTMFKRDKKNDIIMEDWTQPEFGYLKDNLWDCTEKIDGTNIRIKIVPDPNAVVTSQVTFDGRTDGAQISAKLVNWLVPHFTHPRMYEIYESDFSSGVILYGEGFGAGIAKGGHLYNDQQTFILFDVRVGDWWLQRDAVDAIAKTLGIRSVPKIIQATLPEAIEFVRGGFGSTFGDFAAEGLIAEPVVPMFNRKGERIITKIKTRDFKEKKE